MKEKAKCNECGKRLKDREGVSYTNKEDVEYYCDECDLYLLKIEERDCVEDKTIDIINEHYEKNSIRSSQ